MNKEAKRYFVNILNPFAPILSKKSAEIAGFSQTFDTSSLSHGAIWRDNTFQIAEKCTKRADAYSEDQVAIAHDTMWQGTTKNNHKIDKNKIMTELFESRAIAVRSPTVSNSFLHSVAGKL